MITVKDLRTSAGMTQTEFADFFGIPVRNIEDWERGVAKCKPYLIDLMAYKLLRKREKEPEGGFCMMFGLFTLPTTNHLVRCVDGVLSLIPDPANSNSASGKFDAYLNAPALPCDTKELAVKLRNQGQLLTFHRGVAKVLFGVPDNVGLYVHGDYTD